MSCRTTAESLTPELREKMRKTRKKLGHKGMVVTRTKSGWFVRVRIIKKWYDE